jgi:hypothetical protein
MFLAQKWHNRQGVDADRSPEPGIPGEPARSAHSSQGRKKNEMYPRSLLELMILDTMARQKPLVASIFERCQSAPNRLAQNHRKSVFQVTMEAISCVFRR